MAWANDFQTCDSFQKSLLAKSNRVNKLLTFELPPLGSDYPRLPAPADDWAIVSGVPR